VITEGLIWPNFYIVGAAKCGTASLYGHLRKHPQVFLPEVKEPNFFATGAPEGEAVFDIPHYRTVDEYQRLYRKATGYSAIGDTSNSYLWDASSPGRIKEVRPDAKIIMMLRDPVMRAHSFYLMSFRAGDEDASTFREAIERDRRRGRDNWFTSWLYVEGGLYHEQVRRFIDTFGREQVLVLLADELAKDPRAVFLKISNHIGIDFTPFKGMELSEAYNTYRMPRFELAYRIAGKVGLRGSMLPVAVRRKLSKNPILFDLKKPEPDQQSRRYLQEIYDPDITKLEELLGRKLPELRRSWI
jgi:Sulfotransferase family